MKDDVNDTNTHSASSAELHGAEASSARTEVLGAKASSVSALARALARLDDLQLLGRLEELVSKRGQMTAELLAHLGEVDRRKLYLAQACSSMHGYCTARLHLSDAAAYRHIRAARLGRRHPLVLELVAAGKLHLSAVCLLSPYLTEANHRGLLKAAVHRSKRQIEVLIAERFPKPDAPSQLRKLPEPRARPKARSDAGDASSVAPIAPPTTAQELRRAEPSGTPSTKAPTQASSPAENPPSGGQLAPERGQQPTRRPAVVEPLAPARFKVQLTAGQSLYDKLRHAQDLLRHELPSGDLEVICERALDLLLEKLLRRKFAVTDRPRSAQRNKAGRAPEGERTHSRPKRQQSAAPRQQEPKSRHVPAAVKRAVAERDGMRCTFVDSHGRRCRETGGLELHHIKAFAEGGEATVENIALRCWAHNHYDAEQRYGAAYIRRRIRREREQRSTSARPAGPSPRPRDEAAPNRQSQPAGD